MNKDPIIAGNWKMYMTDQEAKDFIQELAPLVSASRALVYIAVAFTFISTAAKAARKTTITIGGQNMHDATEGAFTGEIAGKMLKSAGAEFVILGHSERRSHFHESDEFINKKLLRALKDDLIPILCVGETEDQMEKGKRDEVLKRQLAKGLHGVPKEDVERVIIAYEPIWAIGTGKTATPKEAQSAHHYLRKCLEELFGKTIAEKISILYGGSVKPENITDLMKQKDIDGGLVGGASLKTKNFAEIVNYC